ncbi:hypothetical protein KCU73_g11402, partial [Aureobasidium melanogenum]
MPTVSSHSSKFTSATVTSLHDNDSDGSRSLAGYAAANDISMSSPTSYSANDTNANCTPLLDADDDDSRSLAGHAAADDTSGPKSPLHADKAQMAYETDLLNMSSASSTGETAGPASSALSASSAVHNEPLRRGQRTSRFGQLDYTNGLDVLGFVDEQPNADELIQDGWHSRRITSGTKTELASKAYKPGGNDAKFACIEGSYIPRGANGKFKCPLCIRKYKLGKVLEDHYKMHTSACLTLGREAYRGPKSHTDKTKKSPFSSIACGSVGLIYSTLLEDVLVQTASEFTENDDGDARFQCPVPACGKVLRAQATLAVLWNHCNDAAHQHALYEEDHFRCEMGCEKGFCDALARLCHYADFHYRRPSWMLLHCHEPGYGQRAQKIENSCNPYDARFGKHWHSTHARDAYSDPTMAAKDEEREIGFHDHYATPFHQLGGDASKTINAGLHCKDHDKVTLKA